MDYNLEENFGYNTSFTAKELYEFYVKSEGELNKGTFRWRVYNLKKMGKISSVARGIYILEEKLNFNCKVTSDVKKVFNIAYRMFPNEEMCVWSTEWLHTYMNHQPFNHFIILEVDKYIIDIIFQEIKEKVNNVYLNPKVNEINKYILNENAIIIKPIVKEAPITKISKIKVPKIEKILVDLFFESDLLTTYQGKEKVNIFEEFFRKYIINITTLYRYAKNRGIKEKIENFLLEDTSIDKKYIREVK